MALTIQDQSRPRHCGGVGLGAILRGASIHSFRTNGRRFAKSWSGLRECRVDIGRRRCECSFKHGYVHKGRTDIDSHDLARQVVDQAFLTRRLSHLPINRMGIKKNARLVSFALLDVHAFKIASHLEKTVQGWRYAWSPKTRHYLRRIYAPRTCATATARWIRKHWTFHWIFRLTPRKKG